MWLRALALVCWALAGPAASAPDPLSPWDKALHLDGEWKFRKGDSAEWARPGYDDGRWSAAELKLFERRDILPGPGTAWFRKEVQWAAGAGDSAELRSGRLLALLHSSVTPMELFWDGVPVGRSGQATPGPAGPALASGCNRIMTYLPPGLTGPGKHLLAVRLSNQRGIYSPTPNRISLGEGSALELGLFREAMVMFFLAGIFAFGAVFRFLNYRATGYGPHSFLFSFSILSCSVYIGMQYLSYFVDLGPQGYFATRLILGLSWYFMLSLVPDYFVFAHAFPYRWVLPGLLVGGLFFTVPLTLAFIGLVPFHYLYHILLANQYFSYLSIGTSTWVISWALWRRQAGSGVALLGVLVLLASVWVSWEFDVNWCWAAGLAFHIVCLARAQSQQISERLRRYQEDQLRSARLEIELLKKNIQPHFLLNSLNSIIAWLEEEPKTAVSLVNALADELHMLLKISAEKTIPLDEEIRLCRAHLQVMGLRQDKQYRLVYEGPPGPDHVPPMVLHTLVENGITHGYAGRSSGVFVLKREEVAGGVRYSLSNDGSSRAKPQKAGEGTGLRYVRTRLEEAFPGRWTLVSHPVTDGWRVVLDLMHAQTHAGKAIHESAHRRG